jgi:phosphatidylserine/phosphatidylglycerophosphate/cardiolipin synthase-like enzyme
LNENKEDKVTIAVTGLAWMGNGIRSITSVIEEALPEAKDEIQIAAYKITRGANGFLDLLTDSLSRGIKVSLIVNRFESQSRGIRERLVQLVRQFRHFSLFDFCPKNIGEDLHAKIIVIDRSRAFVGSSNMTWRGLVFNHELGVFVEGHSATRIGTLLDALARDSRTKEIIL